MTYYITAEGTITIEATDIMTAEDMADKMLAEKYGEYYNSDYELELAYDEPNENGLLEYDVTFKIEGDMSGEYPDDALYNFDEDLELLEYEAA